MHWYTIQRRDLKARPVPDEDLDAFGEKAEEGENQAHRVPCHASFDDIRGTVYEMSFVRKRSSHQRVPLSCHIVLDSCTSVEDLCSMWPCRVAGGRVVVPSSRLQRRRTMNMLFSQQATPF